MSTYSMHDDSTFFERHVLTIFVVLCVLAAAYYVVPFMQTQFAQVGHALAVTR